MASQVQGLAFLAVRIAVDFDEQEKFVQPMESIPIIERFQMFISLRFNVSGLLVQFNGYAAMLAFPDDCQLKPTVSLKVLLKSRSPTDSYLPYSRLSIKLEPEKILNKRVARRLKRRKVLHYLVKWKALPATEATWEPETIFHEHPHLLDQIDSPLFCNPYLLRNWRA